MSTDMDYQPVASNDEIARVLAASEPEEVEQDSSRPDILLPMDNEFDLPGGYISPVGEVALDAEVRELTGRDEELIAKSTTRAKALDVVLSRGLIRVGNSTPDDVTRNNLLAGDRDYILLRIYAATFGRELKITRYCTTCQSDSEVSIDLIDDVPVKRLEQASERHFQVHCSVGTVEVDLPTGHTQKALMASADKTLAELSTLLLENTVVGLNGSPVIGRAVVLDMPIRDRRKINDAIAERNPGPQMLDIKVPCPTCESSVEVPLNVAALFQF